MSIKAFPLKTSLVNELPIKKMLSIVGLAALINGWSSQEKKGCHDTYFDYGPDKPKLCEHPEEAHPQ